MAGGMPSPHRTGRLPLSLRPVIHYQPPTGTPAVPHDGRRDGRRDPGPATPATPRHCWVVDGEIAPGSCPGLLLEWRRTPHGWRGRVIFATPGDGDPVLMEAWLPAGLLRPADPR
jgi:hypothetical protein